MKTPIVIVNLKTYAEGTGEKALEIAKEMENVAEEMKCSVAVACQATDIYRISSQVDIPVLAEHFDSKNQGSNTGFTSIQSVKEAGAIGTLLNHSEHRIPIEEIKACLQKAKDNSMEVCLCAKDDEEAEQFAMLNPAPDYIAVEPPDLIGGNVSVTTRPELVENSVKKIQAKNPKIKVIVGAGVKVKEDVKKAIEMGTEGVLLASGVVKASDKEEVLKDLCEGLK